MRVSKKKERLNQAVWKLLKIVDKFLTKHKKRKS